MLSLKDCAIDPGDIVFVVSHSTKFMERFKRAVQSITTPHNKHGHCEITSVFVCTGRNKYGVICHNVERRLGIPSHTYLEYLCQKSQEELAELLINYCNHLLSHEQLTDILIGGPPWARQLGEQFKLSKDSDELVKQLLIKSSDDKKSLIDILFNFWLKSGQADILPGVYSTLLVFKLNNPEVKQRFLQAYLQEVERTSQLSKNRQKRTSYWLLFKAMFKNAQQKETDKHRQPTQDTYCARHTIEVLNSVDPNLVKRGRHVLPKDLEAGLREATQPKIAKSLENLEENDDFEAMIAAQAKLLPDFTLSILPVSGKNLMKNLINVVDKEINRIENHWWVTKNSQQKANELKKLILPYRELQFQNSSINSQVNTALEMLALLSPVLQRKTGFWGKWLSATSYSNVRAFARTQGIFDGDIRAATEKIKQGKRIVPAIAHQKPPENQVLETGKNLETYLFADWSLATWSAEKRQAIIHKMRTLLAQGHALYSWEHGQWVKIKPNLLSQMINGEDFDNLLIDKLKPVSREDMLEQAKKQNLVGHKINFLDYQACQQVMPHQDSFAQIAQKAAPFFSPALDKVSLLKTQIALIDLEMANSTLAEQKKLQDLKQQWVIEAANHQTSYKSGIDTKAAFAQKTYRKPIFKSVSSLLATPSWHYYRQEVYTHLTINENPNSSFDYFTLTGMNATESLLDCQYTFHSNGLNQNVIKQRVKSSDSYYIQGKKQLVLTENWQSLPSLHPEEVLTDCSIQGLSQQDFEIKYSQENHLYYIRLTKPTQTPTTVELKWLLKMPKHYRARPLFNILNIPAKHKPIQDLLLKYFKFGKDNGALNQAVGVTINNGHDYLAKARSTKTGSCRLRVIAFLEEMQRLYPEISVEVTANPNHDFISLQLDGVWQTYCLGGYRNVPSFMDSVKKSTLASLKNISSCLFFKTTPQSSETSYSNFQKHQAERTPS